MIRLGLCAIILGGLFGIGCSKNSGVGGLKEITTLDIVLVADAFDTAGEHFVGEDIVADQMELNVGDEAVAQGDDAPFIVEDIWGDEARTGFDLRELEDYTAKDVLEESISDIPVDARRGCAPSDPQCKCLSDADCDQSFTTVCGKNVCNKGIQVCLISATAKDGEPCDDNQRCTIEDKCLKGLCVGMPDPCDDKNPCTYDYCEEGRGCLHVPRDGTCEDGNLCYGPDHCVNGVCVRGDAIVCDDKNPCTRDYCVETEGCVYEPASGPCDDGNACTTNEYCDNGVCVPKEMVKCDDNNICTQDRCDPKSGCIHEPVTGQCDDGNPCTQGDHCENGQCISGDVISCAVCGDGQCSPPDEDCNNCPQDCGPCPAQCEIIAELGCGQGTSGTTVGGANAMSSYLSLNCLGIFSEEGPEKVVKFTSADDVYASVSVVGGTILQGMDVFVLQQNCVPSSCVAMGLGLLSKTTELIFKATPSAPYFITIDRPSDGAQFSLNVNCLEGSCDDNKDNDNDSLVDCADPDCFGQIVYCNQTVSGKLRSVSFVGGYSSACGNASGSYRDAIFRLDLASDYAVTVRIEATDTQDDLDLYVLASGCTGKACIQKASTSSSSESLTFHASTGSYYFVVEEYRLNSTDGAFNLSIQCN